MPPIAPSPQGSRATLITSLVIFVILFVTSTIMAIHFYTQWEASEKVVADTKNALKDAVNTNVISNNKEVAELISQSKGHAPLTGIEYAVQQKDDLAKLITSNPAAQTEAVKADTLRTMQDARTQLKEAGQSVTLGDDNLLANIKSLTTQISALGSALKESQKQTADANIATANAIKEREAAVTGKQKDIDDAVARATAAEAKDTERNTAAAASAAAIKASTDQQIKDANAATSSAQAELGKVQQELKKQLDLYQKLVSVLNKYRLNPTRALMQPAGVITRVPGNNTVFINLGEGQQISPGLTFEVYDKHKGLPSLTTLNPENPDELPAGKASIEVIRTIGSTSECRIIKVAPGQQIVEGDLILNLIYNTHTKFTFVVYGDFDLAGTGQATAGDADIIRRLITQWGGRVTDQVTVDTDFLVLGKEPQVLPLEDNPNAIQQERHDKQQKALDAFIDRESHAIHLNIPILNQNRFLYFVGYYDQAKR
ncbi:MAG TPA: BRCT domain-containing protein [Tepidisphaeraceae bacterium]|nr:BRCT domain-containing protein [Tepidisphaeraceae bacterium]